MSGRDFCEDCGFDHYRLLCADCGRLLFHVMMMEGEGPVVLAVYVVCAFCDFMDEMPVVLSDPEMAEIVERSLARGPQHFWDLPTWLIPELN